MSKDSKTPQAFPYSGEGDELNYSRGMSLLDYAAIKAMQGMLASGNLPKSMPDEDIAECSYNLAKAMLKARKA